MYNYFQLFLFLLNLSAVAVTLGVNSDHLANSIVNLTSMFFLMIQTSIYVSPIFFNPVIHKFNLFFAYKNYLRNFFCGTSVLSIMFPYYYLIIDRFLSPTNDFIISRYFYSGVAIVSSFIILQLVALTVFFFNFNKKRLTLWKEIVHTENILSFHNDIKHHIDVITQDKSIQEFTDYWLQKSDLEIIKSIPEKAEILYSLLKNKMDYNDDKKIDFGEFSVFASMHNVVDVGTLWQVLSDKGEICKHQLENLLYRLSFSRKRFAYMVHTDYAVVRSLNKYLSSLIYVGCFVLITRIWNYNYVFTDGMDLLKLYILVFSYLAGTLINNIKLLLMMIVNRPFNIGDMLLIKDKVYKMTFFSSSYCHFMGDTFLTLSNDHLLNGYIVNLSSEFVSDSIQIDLPLIFPDCTQDIQNKLQDYAKSNKWEIDEKSVQCVWKSVHGNYKVIECFWRYNFSIHDGNRYSHVKRLIQNFIIDCLTQQLSKSALIMQVASGGAYNDKIKLE